MILTKEPSLNYDEPPSMLTFEHKVGGMLGMGKDSMTATLVLPKTSYVSGEKIPIRISADFSKTSPSTVNYKIVVLRESVFNGGCTTDKVYLF